MVGLPKKTVPPLVVALPVKPVPKKYEKDVLLTKLMENTPVRLSVAGVLLLELATEGTPEIRAVVGIPGTKPVRGVELAVVTVTLPALYTIEPRATEVDGGLTAMPETTPEPPGVT